MDGRPVEYAPLSYNTNSDKGWKLWSQFRTNNCKPTKTYFGTKRQWQNAITRNPNMKNTPLSPARHKLWWHFGNWRFCSHIQGCFSIRKWSKSFSLYTFTKNESHHRSCSHFATPMMVQYRHWAKDLEMKRPNLNTTLRWIFAKIRPKIPRNFPIERPLQTRYCKYFTLWPALRIAT